MTVITFRELQRMTVKDLTVKAPLDVTVNGKKVFRLTVIRSDSQDTMTVNHDSQKVDSQKVLTEKYIPKGHNEKFMDEMEELMDLKNEYHPVPKPQKHR